MVKDFGKSGVYTVGQRDAITEHAAAGRSPRIVLIDDDLTTEDLAALYRSCDVLVHPYRGEGFAMPVLEAMASALPVIVTEGGPTDEFCPDDVAWRIRSRRMHFAEDRIDSLETVGRPWTLEPDVAHLAELLAEADADAAGRCRRGAAARCAAEKLSWDRVARRYAERLTALAAGPPLRTQLRPGEKFPH